MVVRFFVERLNNGHNLNPFQFGLPRLPNSCPSAHDQIYAGDSY